MSDTAHIFRIWQSIGQGIPLLLRLARDSGLADSLSSGLSAPLEAGDCASNPVYGADSLLSGFVKVIAGTRSAIARSSTVHVALEPFDVTTRIKLLSRLDRNRRAASDVVVGIL